MKKLDSIDLDFTSLEFHPKFVVARVKENVLIRKKEVKELKETCLNFYKDKEFVYIAHRINDYTVDPTMYPNLESLNNLAGIAIVSVKAASLRTAEFEQKFSKVPFEIFTDLEEAKTWVKELDLK